MVTAIRWPLLFTFALLLLGGCARADATSTVIPSSPPASTPTSTRAAASPTLTSTPVPTPTAIPTPTPIPDPTPSPIPTEESTAINLIAYIGTDGGLYTIGPGGGEPSRLMGVAQGQSAELIADEGPGQETLALVSHTWPTWSPNGQMLAVSRMTVRGADSISAEVYTITAGSQPTRLYQDPPGVIPLIADNTPHYLYWSPDSKHLTFLANGAQNLDLYVSSVDAPEALVRVMNGAPLYWAWAADSLSMLIHVGDAVLLLDFTTPAGPKELGPRSTAFRAPAWSPVSGQMAYIDQTSRGDNALFVADQDGRDGQPVVDVGEGTAFLWSPTGNSIALLDTDVPSDPNYRALRMVDLESGAIRTLTSEQVVAFFWSPDGEKIAYVAFDPVAQRLSWKVLVIEQGQPRKLVDFLPSQDLFLMLAFFDQYSYSNSLWSPDSKYLVFTGRLTSENEGSSEGNDTADEDLVYVIDVDDPSGLEAIAEGSLAFWSWN